MKTEKRAFARHRVNSGAIQIAAPPGVTLCSVKNIGENGLALDYQPVGKDSFKSDAIDIISHGCYGLYISNISCQTVYDVGRLMEGQSFRGGELRSRGLRFVELSNEQKEKLELLLKSCFSHRPGGPLRKADDFG